MSEEGHPINITKLPKDAYELGQMVRKFRFDALLKFFLGFLNGVNHDAYIDSMKGKKQLAWIQDIIRLHLERVMEEYRKAWQISKPHMKEELERVPEVQ